MGWGGGAENVLSPAFQHALDATLWTFLGNF